MVASSDSPISRQPMCIALLCTHAMEMMILLKTSSIPTRTNMLDVSAEEPNMYEPIRGTAATGTGVSDIPCQDTSRLDHCQHPQHWEVIRTMHIPAADTVKAMAAMLWIETPNATTRELGHADRSWKQLWRAAAQTVDMDKRVWRDTRKWASSKKLGTRYQKTDAKRRCAWLLHVDYAPPLPGYNFDVDPSGRF